MVERGKKVELRLAATMYIPPGMAVSKHIKRRVLESLRQIANTPLDDIPSSAWGVETLPEKSELYNKQK